MSIAQIARDTQVAPIYISRSVENNSRSEVAICLKFNIFFVLLSSLVLDRLYIL